MIEHNQRFSNSPFISEQDIRYVTSLTSHRPTGGHRASINISQLNFKIPLLPSQSPGHSESDMYKYVRPQTQHTQNFQHLKSYKSPPFTPPTIVKCKQIFMRHNELGIASINVVIIVQKISAL